LIDNALYLEAGGYRKLADKVQSDLGISNPAAEHGIDGTAPYWRAALQKLTGPHYVSVGILGFSPHVQLPEQPAAGTNNYTDYGYDATYLPVRLQRRQRQLRRIRTLRARQQHAFPLLVDGNLARPATVRTAPPAWTLSAPSIPSTEKLSCSPGTLAPGG
jgi:hypothetical protein